MRVPHYCRPTRQWSRRPVGKTGQSTLNVASRALGDNTPPTAAITSPADGGAVIGPTPINGAGCNAKVLLNGIYTVRLVAFDRGSNTATAVVPALVDGNHKVTYCTVSHTDLVVPLSGTSLQVIRTYDSRAEKAG
jgi:hypothetical protein